MKTSDMIACESVKNLFGKRNGKFVARVTGTQIDFTADTKEAALAGLRLKLEKADRYTIRRYYHTLAGETICLFHDMNGWRYDITRPGQLHPSTCLLGSDCTEQKAIQAVESHVAQFNADFKAA